MVGPGASGTRDHTSWPRREVSAHCQVERATRSARPGRKAYATIGTGLTIDLAVALPMTASTIEDLAAAAALVLPVDLLIEIDDAEHLRGCRVYGYAWPDGHRITLYRDAFDDEEQLLRTLVHELVHVRQIRSEGGTTNSVLLVEREREAYAEEEHWWRSYLERR